MRLIRSWTVVALGSIFIAACSDAPPTGPADSGSSPVVDADAGGPEPDVSSMSDVQAAPDVATKTDVESDVVPDQINPTDHRDVTLDNDNDVRGADGDAPSTVDRFDDNDGNDVRDVRSEALGEAGICSGVTRAPIAHRSQAVACPTGRAPGTSQPPQPSDQCATDAECTAGLNGRCIFARCSYDDCINDADCGGSGVCHCRPSDAHGAANICLSGGNCRIDGDCGTGNYCSLSQIPGDFGPDGGTSTTHALNNGYFCHTASDCCLDTAECAPNGWPADTCLYSKQLGHWLCAGGP